MRALLLGKGFGILLVLAGCASGSGQSPTPNTPASGKSDSKMICHEETPTGSMFSRTVCRSPEEVEGERNNSQEFLRNQRGRPEPQPGGGR